MAIKFEKLVEGQQYWSRGRQKMGNTTMSRDAERPVRIIRLYPENRSADVSWNHNKPERWFEHRLRRLFRARKGEKRSA